MRIQNAPHTIERALERGASEEEIIETLQTGQSSGAKVAGLQSQRHFPFNKTEMRNILRRRE